LPTLGEKYQPTFDQNDSGSTQCADASPAGERSSARAGPGHAKIVTRPGSKR
jgi:hypothetical protein